MNKDKSCEKRIDEHLQERLEEVRQAISNSGSDEVAVNGEKYDDVIEWLNCWTLCYADDPHYRAKRLELSYGGPADGFRFFEDDTIEYYFMDWFDGATRELHGNDKEIMQELFDAYLNI